MLLQKVWIFGVPGAPGLKGFYYIFLVLHITISSLCDVNLYYFGLKGKK